MTATSAWRCSVCGYVHRGDQPPGYCPVCGADMSEFRPYVESAPTPAEAPARWRCLNCNYDHANADAPNECPVCGAHKDRFEPAAQLPGPEETHSVRKKVLIIGAGIAGISAVEAIRQSAPQVEITLISRETVPPYYRLNLTRYLAGEVTKDDLPLRPVGWYAEQRVDFLTGKEISSFSAEDRIAKLRKGGDIAFDALILATGAHPFMSSFGGTRLEGVKSLRTLADAEQIRRAAEEGDQCVIIGGGLLGLETAGALARQGADVTLLESHEHLMPRQLNRQAADLLAQRLAEMGIKLLTQANTKQIMGDESATGVQLEDGRIVPAGMVVVATGVRPNSCLARQAGLEVNNGVVVTHNLRSSSPNVLAAGDVAEHRGVLYGHWAASQYQGSIAGMNAVGMAAEFGGLPPSSTLKVLNVDVMSIGTFQPEDGSYDVIEDQTDEKYFRFVFHDGRLVGAILFGDASISGPVREAIESKRDVSSLLASRAAAEDVLAYFTQST